MEFLSWLQALGRDANESLGGFQAQPSYIIVSVVLPMAFGLVVGLGMRLVELIFGVELGRGGGH